MTTYEKAAAGQYKTTIPYDAEHREAFYEQERQLMDQFMNDLFQEHGVENNPKRDKAFDMAWSQGSGYGYTEVALIFSELVELIK